MSFLFRSSKEQDKSSDSGGDGAGSAGQGSGQGSSSSGRSNSLIREMIAQGRFSAGPGPGYLNPVQPVAWQHWPTFDDVRAQAAEDAPMAGTPGQVLASDTSIGSSGYSQSQVNGPAVVQDDHHVHTSMLSAQHHLRTQGSETHSSVSLGEMDASHGDKYGFSVSAGHANVDYNGQHTRASLAANGPSTSLSLDDKGPAMKLSTGDVSASGTATASGSRWSASAGFSGSASGPGASLDAENGFQMRGPSASLEGGIGLSRRRDPDDPSSSEQFFSANATLGGLPSVNFNPEAVVHLAQDNPEAVAAGRRGLVDAITDDFGPGMGRELEEYEAATAVAASAPEAESSGGGGGGLWGFVSSLFGGSGSSGGGSSSHADRDDPTNTTDWSSSPSSWEASDSSSSDSSSSDSSSSDSSSSDSSSSDSSPSNSSSSDSSSSDSSSSSSGSPYDSAESMLDYFESLGV